MSNRCCKMSETKNMEEIIKQSFSANLRMMTVIGLYSPENPTLFYKLKSYLLFFLFIVITPLMVFLYLIYGEDDDDATQKSINAAYVFQVLVGFTPKLLPFVIHSDRVKKCIHYLEAPSFAISKDAQKNILSQCAWICRRNSWVFIVGMLAAAVTRTVRSVFMKEAKFAIDIWLPFDPRANPMVFCCVYIYITIAIIYGSLVALVDPLLSGLVHHAAGQFMVLKYNLLHINEDAEEEILKHYADERQKNSTKSKIIYYKIKQCLKHHNAILNFVDEFENCFSWAVFSQLASSVFTLCFLLQRLGTMEELNFNACSYMLYTLVVLGEIYFYCYYGSTLSEQNNSLTTAIYMCNWYDFDIRSKKALVLFMERTQRPVVVSVGKLFPLSLETFTTILRRSYSLLAVLENY